MRIAFENHNVINNIDKNTINNLKAYIVKEKFIGEILDKLTKRISGGLLWSSNKAAENYNKTAFSLLNAAIHPLTLGI